MGIITINDKKYEFTNEKNILSIIRKAGIEVPTLCYQPELSIFGACRLCTVEDDRGRCFASCSEEPRDGMVIYTHTERLRRHRKLIVELLLAAHCLHHLRQAWQVHPAEAGLPAGRQHRPLRKPPP